MSAPTVLANRYELRSILGRGGMGVVWEGYDGLLRRPVAVKEVDFPPGITDAERDRLAARTLREARAVAAIETECAVRVFDVVDQGEKPWLVMELVRGRSLTDLIGASGPLPAPDVARIGLSVLTALEAAHAAGVLHRDVKPGNVLIGDDGRVALTDFGIATVDTEPGDTTTTMVVGSPSYISPERALGEPPQPASDIWSLGATLWSSVEGRAPYTADSPLAVLRAVAYDEPPVASAAPPELQRLLGQMMARDPGARPQPAEIRAALERVAAGLSAADVTVADLPTAGTPGLDGHAAGAAGVASAVTAAPVVRGGDRRRRGWLVGAGVAVVVVAAAGLAIAMSGGSAPARHTTSAKHQISRTPARHRHPHSASPARAVTSGTLPSGWTRYSDAALGWSVGVPPGWQRSDTSSGVQFTDPAGGRYFLIATRNPAGPSAVGAWRSQEASFRSSHAAYQRLELRPVTVAGASQAADWQFEYDAGSVRLHALDRGLVIHGIGYGVYFQTHADQWAASAGIRDSVLATFRTS